MIGISVRLVEVPAGAPAVSQAYVEAAGRLGAADGVLSVRGDYTVSDCDDTAALLLGATIEDIIDKDCREFLCGPEDDVMSLSGASLAPMVVKARLREGGGLIEITVADGRKDTDDRILTLRDRTGVSLETRLLRAITAA